MSVSTKEPSTAPPETSTAADEAPSVRDYSAIALLPLSLKKMLTSSYPEEAVTVFTDVGLLVDLLGISVTLIGDGKSRELVERLACR